MLWLRLAVIQLLAVVLLSGCQHQPTHSTPNIAPQANKSPAIVSGHLFYEIKGLLEHLHIDPPKFDQNLSQTWVANLIDSYNPAGLYLSPSEQRILAEEYSENLFQQKNPAVPLLKLSEALKRKRLAVIDWVLSEINTTTPNQQASTNLAITTIDPVLESKWRLRLATMQKDLAQRHSPDAATAILRSKFEWQRKLLESRPQNEIEEQMLNALLKAFDPQTQYLAPIDGFNIETALRLVGIGLILESNVGEINVVRTVPNGPGDKAGLKPGDTLQYLTEPGKQTIALSGMPLDEAVKVIRGKPKSTIALGILRDNKPMTLQVMRDLVALKEQTPSYTLHTVEKHGRLHSIAILRLPLFYKDIRAQKQGDPNYRSVSRDLGVLLDELNAANVDGIVLDVRNNSGGPLDESTNTTRLFLGSGPIAQLRSYKGIEPLNLGALPQKFNKPLMVWVNGNSAGSSEILAAAVRDYQRGLVIGDRTWGMGYIQSLQPLERGKLKISLAEFYRVTGKPFKSIGVTPDIDLAQLVCEDYAKARPHYKTASAPIAAINYPQLNPAWNQQTIEKAASALAKQNPRIACNEQAKQELVIRAFTELLL